MKAPSLTAFAINSSSHIIPCQICSSQALIQCTISTSIKQYHQTRGFIKGLINDTHLLYIGVTMVEKFCLRQFICLLFLGGLKFGVIVAHKFCLRQFICLLFSGGCFMSKLPCQATKINRLNNRLFWQGHLLEDE